MQYLQLSSLLKPTGITPFHMKIGYLYIHTQMEEYTAFLVTFLWSRLWNIGNMLSNLLKLVTDILKYLLAFWSFSCNRCGGKLMWISVNYGISLAKSFRADINLFGPCIFTLGFLQLYFCVWHTLAHENRFFFFFLPVQKAINILIEACLLV